MRSGESTTLIGFLPFDSRQNILQLWREGLKQTPTKVKTPRESCHRLPPRKNLDGWWTSFRSGLWRLRFQLSPEGNRRYDDLVSVLHDTKVSVLGDRDDEAWYLLYLGTKPSARGKGYARKLLEFMVQRVKNKFSIYPPLGCSCLHLTYNQGIGRRG